MLKEKLFIVSPSLNLTHFPSEIIKLEMKVGKRNLTFHIKWCLSAHGNDVSHAKQTRQKLSYNQQTWNGMFQKRIFPFSQE
jgi:hypothetical protein